VVEKRAELRRTAAQGDRLLSGNRASQKIDRFPFFLKSRVESLMRPGAGTDPHQCRPEPKGRSWSLCSST
jgi:hypothetical protein